jgi:hypothetical protein
MRYLIGVLAAALLLLSPRAADAQLAANPDPNDPDFRLTVYGQFDAETIAEFRKRLQGYVELRRIAEVGAFPLRVTDKPDEITRAERELTARIRELRGSSDRGQLFVRRMTAQLKKLLVLQVDSVTLNVIMEDGPGEFDVDVNEAYPKKRSLATMPPKILLQLPELPPDIEYRFVGRHLILRDVRANMIIDKIPHALECRDCVLPPEEIHETPDR